MNRVWLPSKTTYDVTLSSLERMGLPLSPVMTDPTWDAETSMSLPYFSQKGCVHGDLV